MQFFINEIIHGFRVTENAFSDELEGRIVRMIHEKTGAELFWLDNQAENMVFSISFCTLPEDNTGVFHILEHSVLCGSRDFPVKEPFVELLKSSMSTFLNAMTFPDMTMYPVSSRNPRDLLNLTHVYLDAVFAPAVIHDVRRFCQEGWHIDRDEKGNPEYRGVVYNEMKGAMGDTDTLIDRQLMKMLFPDTSYGFNSGGDPEEIPDLTWDQFKVQYEKHYHPSNARIYLDGTVPMEEMLKLIDSYLSAYERRENLPAFKKQEPKAAEAVIEYELGADETEENRGYLTLGRITGTWQDREENFARSIIADVLTGSNDAPLKRAALERNLCQDLSLSVDDTGLQSWIAVHAENVTDGKEQDILNLLQEMGERIRKEGLNREAAEASLNRAAYNLREEDEPRGIGRCIRCMGSWLYGGKPEEALENREIIRKVRKMLAEGTFDVLAADMLLNRENNVVLHTRPSHTLGEEKRRKESERIWKTMAAWTADEKNENDRLISELEAWQCSPDSDEDLQKLPVLNRKDADVSPEWTETETETVNEVLVLRHRIPCNGVVHLRAYFPLTDFTLEEMTPVGLVTGMLGKLPTTRHDALKLQQEIKRYTGACGFSVISLQDRDHDERCTPYLTAFVSALEENADKAQELLAEILTETRFDGQEDRIREMMMQNELGSRQRIVSAGTALAVKNVLSHYSADAAVKNALDGDRAATMIHAFAQHPEKEMPGLLATARRLMDTAIGRKRMTVSLTTTACVSPERLIQAIPAGTEAPETAVYRSDAPERIGYRIPAQIGFVARGYRLNQCGGIFSGRMLLISSILSLDYLWNRTRVQGGAYGAGFTADRYGNLFSYSFRDPTPSKTLQTDNGASTFLREFIRSGENLDKYIISCLNELNPLISPRDKGAVADMRKLTGYTREEAERVRREVLEATSESLLECISWLDAFAEKGSVCVVAHADALDNCEGLLVQDL